jgi:hypothetical protein
VEVQIVTEMADGWKSPAVDGPGRSLVAVTAFYNVTGRNAAKAFRERPGRNAAKAFRERPGRNAAKAFRERHGPA